MNGGLKLEKLKITTERLFLRSPNINVCFRIIVSGGFDTKNFSLALETVCTRHPLLKCCIEIDTDYNAWFVPNAHPIEAVYYKHGEMPDWKNWYKKTDAMPFDFMRGPLVKICVITGDNQTEIIIVGHHIIGDGLGYLNLANDLLAAMDNRLEAVPHIPPANNKFITGKKIGFVSGLYAKKLNKAWRNNKIHFSENDYREFFRNYRTQCIPQMYMNSINQDELKKIIDICKLNNLTVNELMTSAFAAAFAGDREVRIGVAASTRRELSTRPCSCMGNYVTGISIKTNGVSGNDFMANVQNITKLLRAELTDAKKRHAIVNFLGAFDGDLIESIMYASYGEYQLPTAKKIGVLIAEGLDGKGLGISNLGRHEMNNYNGFRLLDLQFIGPVFPANILSVSMITVNNKLTICLRYNETEIATNTVKMIYKKAIDSIFNH